MIWSENIVVDFHDADYNGILRAASALKYMQNSANSQLEKMGPTMAEIQAAGQAFVLSRINLRCYAPICAYDEITAQTWVCESRGVSFNRCYRLLRNGLIAAEASSVWALINFESKKICRVNEIEINIEPDEPLELDVPRKIKFPENIRPSLIGERGVLYSDLDKNRHINNTRYLDILCDFIPAADMEGRRVAAVSICYLSEAALGGMLKVYCCRAEDSYFFRTVNADGSANIEAELILDEI